jgi:hypothetical protein
MELTFNPLGLDGKWSHCTAKSDTIQHCGEQDFIVVRSILCRWQHQQVYRCLQKIHITKLLKPLVTSSVNHGIHLECSNVFATEGFKGLRYSDHSLIQGSVQWFIANNFSVDTVPEGNLVSKHHRGWLSCLAWHISLLQCFQHSSHCKSNYSLLRERMYTHSVLPTAINCQCVRAKMSYPLPSTVIVSGPDLHGRTMLFHFINERTSVFTITFLILLKNMTLTITWMNNNEVNSSILQRHGAVRAV